MSEFNDFDRRPDDGTFESCFNAIQRAQFFVLLVGDRRGSWYKENVSVTQQEFRIAKGLADQGSISIIPLIRAEVMTAYQSQEKPDDSESELEPPIAGF